MRRIVAWLTTLAGFAGTTAAVFWLPWARYGSISIELMRFPGWGWYAAASILLHLAIGWTLVASPLSRLATLIYGALLLAAVGAALVLMSGYDNSSALFDENAIIPMVMPSPWTGGPVAIVAAASGYAGLLISRRT